MKAVVYLGRNGGVEATTYPVAPRVAKPGHITDGYQL